ncbi:MAG: hypothetical protein H0X27_05845 [Caulobacteraceae bacterium]|nr:hypothetical protein [Caulobacteraceae bacterium]
MSPVSVRERAGVVLGALGVLPASRAASGRYLRSLPIAPGVRYWATSQPRLEQDFLGVQFYGEGTVEAPRCAEGLMRAGFKRRMPQTGQITFAKPVSFAPRGGVDTAAIRAVRRELDAILRRHVASGERPEVEKPVSFRQFMLASPLADFELRLPPRAAAWRTGEL